MQTKPLFISVIAIISYGLPAFSQQFYNPLVIPPALSGTEFNLTEASAVHQFYQGVNTPTWGYNGYFLGPTLIFNRGDSVNIHVTNNLPDTTTVHWHGLLVPPKYDGGPHSLIFPGGAWNAHFKIRNQASTHWYHPHGNMKTTVQVTKGLAGLIIVKDTIESKLNLPRTYGVDDIPVILQDRRYDSTGNFIPIGLGDSMLVNGTSHPYANLPAQVVRLRNLNASTGRFYYLGFNDNRDFYVIASDASLLKEPYKTNRILMGVGERYEILVDLTTNKLGDSLFLMSYGSEMGPKVPGGSNLLGEESPLNAVDFEIMKINVVSKTGTPVITIPSSLITLVPINPSLLKTTRTKHIKGHGMVGSGAFSIDDIGFNMDAINDTVLNGSIEKWIFTNSSSIVHPIHIHGVSFFILDRNGNPPLPYEAGLKDVFIIRPNIAPDESVSLIMKFEDYTDDKIPYMYHCHLLRHEDMGMMHSFLVVDGNNNGTNDPQNDTQSNFVYPNPSTGKFTIEEEEGAFSIYNLIGEKILDQRTCRGNCMVDLSSQPKGIYFLKILSKEGMVTKKIVIQ